MYSISITIGRNIGNKPMDKDLWIEFKDAVNEQLLYLKLHITVTNQGTGVWEGITEENFIVKGIREKPFADNEIDRLAKNLSVLSAKFKQDAIAYSVGKSILAFAE